MLMPSVDVPQPNDNCPLCRHRNSPYIGGMRHSRAMFPSFPRRFRSLLSGRGPRIEGSGDGKSNEMQPNATDLKVSPLLATRDEANQGHNLSRLAHRVRVSGAPNEATVASFLASPLGVNEANQGQMGPRSSPPSFPVKAA